MKIKPLTANGATARLLTWLARLILRYRRLLVFPQVLLFLFCVLYTYQHLEFDTNRAHLVGPGKRYHENYQEFRREFASQDDLVVVVESENTEKNRQFVERLGVRLEKEPALFKNVFYKGDLRMLGSKALLFLPEPELESLQQALVAFRPFIDRFAQATNLVTLFSQVNAQFRTARRETNATNDSLVEALPALERIVVQATDSLRRRGIPPSPGITTFFDPNAEAEQRLYITFDQGRLYLVTAQAVSQDMNPQAVRRLRELVQETRIEVSGVNADITGEPVLELDEMAQSQRDTTVASVVALILCALIFIYGYQETGRPIKATLCLVVGIGYTLGFTTLTVGHLNILTITFLPILIGLSIDYGVHLISRYEEELRHGRSEETALTTALVYTGQGIFTGALTTAGAFLAMAITDFRGIQEMGIICGGGMLVCLVPMMTMLPALLLQGRQNEIDHHPVPTQSHRARIEQLWLGRPVTMTVATLILTGLAATQLPKVFFDYNLLNMQSAGLPAVKYEHKLIESASKSVLFGALVATNLEHAAILEQQATNLPAVASVDSMVRFLTEDQSRKLKRVTAIKQQLATLTFPAPDLQPVDISELSATLYYLYGYLGAAREAVQQEQPELDRKLMGLREKVVILRKEMQPGDMKPEVAEKLAAFQRALFRDVRETFEALRGQEDQAPLRVEDLPPGLRNRFVGHSGKHLVMAYPRKDVWQREHQEEFIQQLQTIDPDVTGTPVQLYYYTELLKTSYEEAARYSLIAIALLVFLHFRSPISVALALVPVVIGFVWLGGLMGFFGIPLNPANIMMLPLVIGIGVTNGIQVLNRYAEEQSPAILARSTGKAVLVSGLTSIAGFGSLMLAEHQGIKSLGYVMALGLAACMVAGLTFLPALLNLMGRRHQKNRPGADNARSTPSREEPR